MARYRSIILLSDRILTNKANFHAEAQSSLSICRRLVSGPTLDNKICRCSGPIISVSAFSVYNFTTFDLCQLNGKLHHSSKVAFFPKETFQRKTHKTVTPRLLTCWHFSKKPSFITKKSLRSKCSGVFWTPLLNVVDL